MGCGTAQSSTDQSQHYVRRIQQLTCDYCKSSVHKCYMENQSWMIWIRPSIWLGSIPPAANIFLFQSQEPSRVIRFYGANRDNRQQLEDPCGISHPTYTTWWHTKRAHMSADVHTHHSFPSSSDKDIPRTSIFITEVLFRAEYAGHLFKSGWGI